MSAAQYIGLIAALLLVAGAAEQEPRSSALMTWLSVGLALVAVLVCILYRTVL